MIRDSFEPSQTMSQVAQRHDINPNQLCHWHQRHQDGNLSVIECRRSRGASLGIGRNNEANRKLQRLLSKKTMAADTLKETREAAHS